MYPLQPFLGRLCLSHKPHLFSPVVFPWNILSSCLTHKGGKTIALQNFLNPSNFPHYNHKHTEAGNPLNCSSCPTPSSREGSALLKSPFNLHLYQTAGAAAANCCCCCPGICCPKAHWFSVQKKGSNICICDFCGFGSTSKHQDKRCVSYALFTKMLPAAREMGGILLQS